MRSTSSRLVRSQGVVVIGGFINGLGIVRALAARNIPTAVVRTQRYDIAHRSRWISSHEAVFGIEDRPELLVELLERSSSRWRGWALLPTTDEGLAAIAQHWDRLSSAYRVLSPPWEIARHLLDKDRMLEAAQSVGIDVPVCYGPAVNAAADRSDLCYPVLVKPACTYAFSARFGQKLFIAHDRGELRDAIAQTDAAGISCSLFEFVPGPDSQIYVYCAYIDQRGEPSAGITARKLRQSPPRCGVARAIEIAPDNPALREATVELVRRIGFRGIAVAEFKRDPRDGTFRFIEINGRSVIYNALLRKGGLDLANLAWADSVEGRSEPVRPTGWRGVWINLPADLFYSAVDRRFDPVSLTEFLSPYGRPKIEAVWSTRDPGPALLQWSRATRDGGLAIWKSRLPRGRTALPNR